MAEGEGSRKVTTILSPAEAREQLDWMFVTQCRDRRDLRANWMPLCDPKASASEKRVAWVFLDARLKLWAKDPLTFIKDLAWAPDPLEKFAQVPEGLTPKGMIPIMPFKKQADFIELWWKALSGRRRCDIFGEKSRQQAFTTLAGWLCLHAWLFRKSTYGMLTTFAEEKIDKGGKGQRESDSLFGRLRLFLDAFMWSFGPCAGPGATSILRFNQDQAKTGRWLVDDKRKFHANITGLTEADDITKKLTRPRWCIGNHKDGWRELFPGAEGNYIVGEMPSDAAGRSLTLTYAIFDELAHYRKEIKRISTPDDDVYSASASNVRVRVGWGTPPKGGGSDTLLYRELHVNGPSPIKKTFRMHWTENPAFMIGAWWRCPSCGHPNPVPPFPPPKWPSDAKICSGCQHAVPVFARGIYAPSGGSYSSPLYEDECAAIPDKAGIAAELEIDWGGALTGAVFSNFEIGRAVVERENTRGWQTIHGFDPGYSVKNPAAWSCWRYSAELGKLRLVAYHQAANWEWWQWVPFFKCWAPGALKRMPMMHRSHKVRAQRWDEYGYPPDALAMLDHVSKLAHSEQGFTQAIYRGDKYGTHSTAGMESPYDALLRRYGIFINSEYVKDDQTLLATVRDSWIPNIEIDPRILDHRPSSPAGDMYPSFVECVQTAKWVETTGQREEKREIANDPPGVKHLIDTMKYVVLELPELVEAGYVGGDWGVRGGSSEPFDWGGDDTLG